MSEERASERDLKPTSKWICTYLLFLLWGEVILDVKRFSDFLWSLSCKL
jgi:hypothetical protein